MKMIGRTRMKHWWEDLTPAQRTEMRESVMDARGAIDRSRLPVPIEFGAIISWDADTHSTFILHEEVCEFVENQDL